MGREKALPARITGEAWKHAAKTCEQMNDLITSGKSLFNSAEAKETKARSHLILLECETPDQASAHSAPGVTQNSAFSRCDGDRLRS